MNLNICNSKPKLNSHENAVDAEEFPFSHDPEANDIWGNQYLADDPTKYDLSDETFRYRVLKIRITEDSPEVLVKFGHPLTQYETHYLELPGELYGAYYRCLGEDCPACAAGMKRTPRRVDFFYSISSGYVVYHVHTADRKPNSFSSKLARACVGGYPAVLIVSRPDQYTYDIQRVDDPSCLETAARVVKVFLEDLAADRVDLDEVVRVADREDMLAVPKITTILRIRGRN